MIQHGTPPYLECSTRGDARFSAFKARIAGRGFQTIEELYQSAKRFSPGEGVGPDGHMIHWRLAKGKRATNQAELAALYELLWSEYLTENPSFIHDLIVASGLSDMFGQQGHVCQATVLWMICEEHIKRKIE